MAKRNGVWKVFSIIGILLIAVLLCYFSVALYFYFGKPNDISSKLKVWNLMSNESVGEMYVDASFDIREVNNSNETGYYGINLDERGYVLTLASNVEEGETYLLYRKNGEIYSGTCVFDEENFNLAIIKINAENLSLPYVKVGTMNNGKIDLFADNSEVSTFNNGKIDEMIGRALISANMNGEIGYQEKQTIILYSPKESAKRMSEYRQEKEEAIANAQEISPLSETTPEPAQDTTEQETKLPEQIEERIEKPKRKSKLRCRCLQLWFWSEFWRREFCGSREKGRPPTNFGFPRCLIA